jgi:hypothetical protein
MSETAPAVRASVPELRAALREYAPGHWPHELVAHLLDALDAEPGLGGILADLRELTALVAAFNAMRAAREGFTEGLLEQVAQPGNGRADARLARLTDAISAASGTDGDTATWLAARVFGTLESMAVESGAYPADGTNGKPWDVTAWLTWMNKP